MCVTATIAAVDNAERSAWLWWNTTSADLVFSVCVDCKASVGTGRHTQIDEPDRSPKHVIGVSSQSDGYELKAIGVGSDVSALVAHSEKRHSASAPRA